MDPNGMNGHDVPVPVQPNIVQPAPTPLTWQLHQAIGSGPDAGKSMVIIVFSTVTGQHVTFMTADDARNFAKAIERAASSLVIPT